MSSNNRRVNLHGIQAIFVPVAYQCVVSHIKSCDDMVLSYIGIVQTVRIECRDTRPGYQAVYTERQVLQLGLSAFHEQQLIKWLNYDLNPTFKSI